MILPYAATPGGETLLQMTERVRAAYANMLVIGQDKTIGLVAHGGPLQLLPGFLHLTAAEEHPAQAVDVGRVVLVAVGADLGPLPLLALQPNGPPDQLLRLFQVPAPVGAQTSTPWSEVNQASRAFSCIG